ncbi:MAG TPA: TetR/AcrR family transcriptional regulator [Tissierellia bacterium]|nr:TetR/AcrR family transcriptional regulator [Tissierellia bacterium]
MVTRREKEIEAMRKLIISTASEIIAEEGLDNLSIRKIAKKIEYSPSVIYNYFKDKEEIVNTIMRSGYMKIVSAVSASDLENLPPTEKLAEMTRNYIEEALKMPDEFLSVQVNQTPQVLKYTSYLFKGAAKEKPALSALFNCLKEIHKDADYEQTELKAQIIAASTMGLIIKLIVEKDIEEDQRQKLIDCFIKEIILKI